MKKIAIYANYVGQIVTAITGGISVISERWPDKPNFVDTKPETGQSNSSGVKE